MRSTRKNHQQTTSDQPRHGTCGAQVDGRDDQWREYNRPTFFIEAVTTA